MWFFWQETSCWRDIHGDEWLQWNSKQDKQPIFQPSFVLHVWPCHLIKKLRNNIYNSGYKEHSPRYTGCLLLNSKNILNHTYPVYLRDKRRHIFSTDIRSSHVHIDSLSKMHVNLAVQVLNSKVRKDMEKFESDFTISTQKFIYNCQKLWGVFNDDKRLS